MAIFFAFFVTQRTSFSIFYISEKDAGLLNKRALSRGVLTLLVFPQDKSGDSSVTLAYLA